ncbi:ras association domain-containing protein 10 [Callorhinchus milii]|uniref:ras association domain-containing protein 10 n=1 Tax=Callorhinchus milii TaxID=7868 RepID=UPI001C3F7D5B|nr:ras association domain-containing protein 10 [Callorhinchus milii]
MDTEQCKITVWLCQEEKVVSGLSKRTSCADVVRALVLDQERSDQEEEEEEGGDGEERDSAMLSGSLDSYCIVEKWRGFERTLPNKTKLLRLWAAWGEERDNVTFVLVRSEASLANSGARSAQARVVLSRETPCAHRGSGSGRARLTLAALPRDKQRRIVRKAFRKLAKINRKRRGGRDSGGGKEEAVGRMETLVHLVLSQDHTLRQQLQRLRELDREIDRYQVKVHLDRMQRHGVNYVQDTYLVDGAGEEENPNPSPHPSPNPSPNPSSSPNPTPGAEAVTRGREQVQKLQDQLSRQEELIERTSLEIQEELNRRWMKRRREGPDWDSHQPGEQRDPEAQVSLSLERLQTQLDTSLYIGLRLNTDLENIRKQLSDSQGLCEDKERELQSLAMEVAGSLTIQEPRHRLEPLQGEEVRAGDPGVAESNTAGWGEALTLSKTCLDINEDEDSDTGLSSMHSQDSDNVPVCESLV